MRTMSVTVAGSVYTLPVNFKAISLINARGCDPWQVFVRYSLGNALSLLEIINILIGGMLAGGAKIDADDMADTMVDEGAAQWHNLARDYVMRLCDGKSEQPDAAGDKADPKK